MALEFNIHPVRAWYTVQASIQVQHSPVVVCWVGTLGGLY